MTDQCRHEWDGDETRWHCTQCAETTATCGTCWGPVTGPRGTASSLLLCERCLSRERGKLKAIMEAAERIIHEPRSVVPAYAADLARARSTDPERLPFGLDTTTDDPDRGVAGIRTAEGIESELWGWVALWWDAGAGAENLTAHEYLASRLLWAGHNPATSHWDRYRDAMTELLRHARSLGAPAVEKVGPACFTCGGSLVREWREDGLGKDVRCGTCKEPYNAARYLLALRARIEDEADPDATVTTEEVTRIWPTLTRDILKKAARDRRLTGVSDGYRTHYRIGDVREFVRERRRAG